MLRLQVQTSNLQTPKTSFKLYTQNQIFGEGPRLAKEIKKLNSGPEVDIISSPKEKKPAGYWKSKENIFKFLKTLGDNLNLKTPKEWNSITQKQIKLNGGSNLLHKYTMNEIKSMACPDGKLLYSKPNKPPGYWENKDNILHFLEEIKQNYDLKTPQDWNKITQKQIKSNGGISLLQSHSMYDLKCLGCPEGFGFFSNPQKPDGYWNKPSNIIIFLNELKIKLNLNSIHDWNLLTTRQIQKNGGSRLLKSKSLLDIKCLGCPEGKELFHREFKRESKDIYQILEILKNNLHLETPNDWNLLTVKQIRENGGNNLLNSLSLYEIKCLGCPEGKESFSKPNKPSGYWNKLCNIKEFLEEFRNHMNLKSPEDWNLITSKQIRIHGGSMLLQKYSLYELKCIACPEGKYLFSDSKHKSSSYWNNDNNIQLFIQKLKDKYNIKSENDWKRISKTQIRSAGGSGLLAKHFNHDEKRNLIEKNPELIYISGSCISDRPAQRWLFLQIQKLFPDDEIVEDFFHNEISRQSGFNVQFDIFIINRNIAFEYHGKQHYEDLSGFASLEMYKSRDEEKINLCKKFGIQLKVIPYWWDNTLESLKKQLCDLTCK